MAIKPAPTKEVVFFGERYRVISTLGAGGMATVYLAMDERLDRLVAVKVIHSHLSDNKTLIERFKNEARTAASLRSPYIVEIYDFGVHEGSFFFVMEFIDGQTLNWILDRLNSEPMDPDVAAALVCQIAEGLSVVIQPGIVHRDLKPENILISPLGYLKITDFGIVFLKDRANLTSTGQVLGTPRFMSPEQVRGRRQITHQSDLFSIGVIFYYCLAGRLPFQGDSIHQVMSAIAEERHTPLRSLLPNVDPHLESLIETLLQKDPAKRGPGAQWLQSELKKYLFKRQVVDPVARIKGYLAELSARGIQTIREIDWLEVEIEMRRHNENKKTRPALSRYSTFRGQVTRMFDRKSKWLWGVLLFILALVGMSGTYVAREYYLLSKNTSTKAAVAEKQAAAKPEPAKAPVSPEPVQPVPRPVAVSYPAPTLEPIGETPVTKEPSRMERRAISKPVRKRAEPKKVEAGEAIAKIYAISSPPFAEVFAGDQSWGFCPLREVSVRPGRYHLHISWQNSRSIDTIVQVGAGPNRFQFSLPGE